jgi:uncharacterized protein (TIGR02145 family)
MKKLLLIPAFILLMSPLMAEAQQNQLSRDARIDLLEVRALNALNSEDWPLFLENIEELDELGADLGIEVVLFVGRAHFELQQYERSYENVSGFLEATGREHPNYVEALSLYDEVSGVLETQRRQRAEEDRLYNRAVNDNNLPAAQQYLRDYPQGRYRPEISRALDELTYRDAVRSNTASDLDNYINSYPNGRFVSEARNRKEELLYTQAMNGNNLVARQYLRDYPQGRYRSEVKNVVEELTNRTKDSFNTVTIGNQVWDIENLNVDKFRNGDPIPEARNRRQWREANNEGKPAWIYYRNRLGDPYGKMYNWYAVNDPRGLAPEGCRVPSVEEWKELIEYLGGENAAGDKMKSTSGWRSIDGRHRHSNGTNESGFFGQPHGYRNLSGQSQFRRVLSRWWSSSEKNATDAFRVGLDGSKHHAPPILASVNKGFGFHVRCLRE